MILKNNKIKLELDVYIASSINIYIEIKRYPMMYLSIHIHITKFLCKLEKHTNKYIFWCPKRKMPEVQQCRNHTLRRIFFKYSIAQNKQYWTSNCAPPRSRQTSYRWSKFLVMLRSKGGLRSAKNKAVWAILQMYASGNVRSGECEG